MWCGVDRVDRWSGGPEWTGPTCEAYSPHSALSPSVHQLSVSRTSHSTLHSSQVARSRHCSAIPIVASRPIVELGPVLPLAFTSLLMSHHVTLPADDVAHVGEEGGRRSRKRRRSVTQHGDDSSSSAATSEQFSSPSVTPVSAVRGAPLPASSLAYFRSLHSSLQAAADSGSDVQLIVAAAYGELAGVEYRMLVNKHGSRCIEALIAHSTASQLAALLSATRTAAAALLVDRHASHPMQKLIERLPRLLLDEQRAGMQEKVGSLSASLLAFCQSLAESPSTEQGAAAVSQLSAPPSSYWPLLFMQEQGSFAIRALARLMSGATDISSQSDTARPLTARSGSSGSGGSVSGVGYVAPSVSHVSFLRPVLSALVDSVVELKEADRIELAFHTAAAPALSELILTLAAHPHYHSLLEAMLLALVLTGTHQPTSAVDDEPSLSAVSVSSRGVAHVAQLVRHRVGSHLFECILLATRQLPPLASGQSAETFTFATLVCDTLQGDLAELATHPTGNHVLQTALSLCTHSERHFIKTACSTLGTQCRQLIGQQLRPPHIRPTSHCAHICHRTTATHAALLP